jgi:hypothetical protein
MFPFNSGFVHHSRILSAQGSETTGAEQQLGSRRRKTRSRLRLPGAPGDYGCHKFSDLGRVCASPAFSPNSHTFGQ